MKRGVATAEKELIDPADRRTGGRSGDPPGSRQGMDAAFRLQCVEGLSTALARIAGGGVDLVLLDLSLCGGRESGSPRASWHCIARLRTFPS